jgi:hypothetical protein
LSTRVPYFAHNGDALAAASTPSTGAIRDSGGDIRQSTTGVGTPVSDRIVIAASLGGALGGGAVGLSGHGQARQVALDVGDEHRHSRGR